MQVVSTHPYGEVALEPSGDCCLGSINLPALVLSRGAHQARLDLHSLQQAIRFAVRLLDHGLTWRLGSHPLPQHEEAAARGRGLGLGLMGFADMVCQLGVTHDTGTAIEPAAE